MTEPPNGTTLMLLRLGLQAAAGYLVSKGIGDDALWTALIGVAISGGGIIWSYFERRKLVKAAS